MTPQPPPSTVYGTAIDILKSQGAAVFFMLWVLFMTSGILPNKLCESTVTRDQIISTMERDRKDANDAASRDRAQIINALQKIGEAMEVTMKATARMDTRDAIKTCASIPDQRSRVSCVEVAVTGK